MKFRSSPDKLPVLWHQSLLIFAQRYKRDLTDEQRQNLISLLSEQHHDIISAEVIRELQQGLEVSYNNI